MKKALLVPVFLLLAVAGLAAQTNRTMYVATKNVSMRTGTGLFAGTVPGITLNYGDAVAVLREQPDWMEVRPEKDRGKTGWVRSNSLSARRIESANGASASARELALAGKGFSQEVENSWRQNAGANADYADIDRMEEITVPLEDLRQFLTEGRLRMGGE